MIDLKRILVPTDFSGTSVKALCYGEEFATKFGAELHLLHVVEVPPILYGEGGGYPPDPTSEIDAAANAELSKVHVEAGDLQVIREVVQGHAFVEIVRYAREHAIDLIAMGTHGRGAIAHLLLGNVAERVVRKASCPVLVVRDEEHEFVAP